MTERHLMKRIEKAQMQILFKVPFFAAGMCRLPVEFKPGIKTACTNGKRIQFDPEFCERLTDNQIVTVICHEVAHCLLGHLWRIPRGGNWKLWNQATDHVINLMLKEFSAMVMAQNLADPFPFPEPVTAYLADPQFTGKAEEVVYDILAKQQGQGGGGGKGQAQGQAQQGSMPSFGDIEAPDEPLDSDAQHQLETDWTATLLQSARIAARAGKLPGNLERLVDSIVHPKVDWYEILMSKLRELAHDDWDFLVPAVEFEPSGFLLPSLRSEKVGAVVFGSDWSGSTFGELVNKFHASKQDCLDQLHPRKLTDIGFDTRVLWEHDYQPGDTINPKIAGGGGTSFVPVIERCNEMDPPPKCVVILTDLDGAFPSKAPDYPVIWLKYGGCNKVAPFGEVIEVE